MPSKVSNRKSSSAVDIQVGEKIKACRIMRGLTQEQLANLIGLTFQQVQKYERGTNRVTIGRLIDIGKALNAPMYSFLDESQLFSKKKTRIGEEKISDASDLGRDAASLVRAYLKIKNPKLQKTLLKMAYTLASDEE